MKRFRLYGKFGGEKRFKPMDYNKGEQVTNLIHATLFTTEEVESLKGIDAINPEWTFEFREVKNAQ